MITVVQRGEPAGLASNEIVLGARRSARHRLLLSSYVLNLWRGPKTVRKMIIADNLLWLNRNARLRGGLLTRVAAISFRLSRSQTGTTKLK